MSKGYFLVERKTIGDVYIQPKNKFRIPRFQRQYTWEENQIEEFWETIVSKDPVFIGTIILDISEKDNENIVEIIDGQQRYLTIQILGAVIRNVILIQGKLSTDEKFEKKAKGINTRIIGTPNVDDDELYDDYLIPGDSIKDFFKKYIQNYPSNLIEEINDKLKVQKNSEEERVKKAYLKFKILVEKEIESLSFKDKYEWL
ncbi:DUF262 domain-containing protein, partial [Flavobacterium sp.]|uniref:DUF262 domain-containing protein n=1 Tax=Flavobacterium sp. TaxID=239 RepID=UPI000EED4196